jgi:hypothetical protein
MVKFDGSPVDDALPWESEEARRQACHLVNSMSSEPPIGPTHDQKNASNYSDVVMAMVVIALNGKEKGTHFTSYRAMTQFTIDRCLQTQFSSSVFNLMSVICFWLQEMLHLRVATTSWQRKSIARSAIPDCQPNLTLEDFNGSVYRDSDIVSQATSQVVWALDPEHLPEVPRDELKTSLIALSITLAEMLNDLAVACYRHSHGLRSFHLFVSFMHVLSYTTFALVSVC